MSFLTYSQECLRAWQVLDGLDLLPMHGESTVDLIELSDMKEEDCAFGKAKHYELLLISRV